MATAITNPLAKLQVTLEGALAGLTSSNLSLLNGIAMLGVSLSKTEAITKLKVHRHLFTAVSNAKPVYVAALLIRESSMEDVPAF